MCAISEPYFYYSAEQMCDFFCDARRVRTWVVLEKCNIAIQLVMRQCCKTNCTLVRVSFPAAFKVRYLPPNIMDWFLFEFHLPPPPTPSALRSEYLTTSPKCGIKLNCQAKTSCLESITVLSGILV